MLRRWSVDDLPEGSRGAPEHRPQAIQLVMQTNLAIRSRLTVALDRNQVASDQVTCQTRM